MIEGIKYHLKLNRLYRDIRKSRQKLDQVITQAVETNEEELKETGITYAKAEASAYECILLLKEYRYYVLSHKYDIPLPDKSDLKMWTTNDGDQQLSQEGRHYMRRAIRQEQKERLEPYVNIVAMLTGLGGVVIGILALLSS